MVAVFVGRVIRFGVESLLVIRYGPQILHSFSAHTLAASIVIGALIALGVVWYILRARRKRKKQTEHAESN
jgi:membrane protein DedA with SNARE-associated domain